KHLRRAVHWSAGVHECWSADQHDKWQWFRLFLHVGLDNFSNYILWLKVWWTNSNPWLIASFYLEAASRFQGILLLTQSDPGSENHGMANAQTTLHQMLDPDLHGMLQHQWMCSHSNIKPEIFWLKLWHQWAEGWEAMFQEGLDEGWYHSNDELEHLVFHWLMVPMIQANLDHFGHIHNSSKPCKDNKKAMPAEIPAMLLENPAAYGPYHDYKAKHLEIAGHLYAPAGHEVFQLVPQTFAEHAQHAYIVLCHPEVNCASFWEVYSLMLH
ncbi:hypothetical protein DACRYDRAFT_40140, partial [Dacryopinax primogenitus]